MLNKFFFLDQGKGQTIVLLPAFPLTHVMWKNQIKYLLNKQWRVITVDYPGFGKNAITMPNAIHIEGLAQNLNELLMTLDVEYVVLVGLSMGGYVSFSFYAQYPHKIKAMVLANTKAASDTPLARENRYQLREKIKNVGMEAVVDALLPKLFAPETYHAHTKLIQSIKQAILQNKPQAVMETLLALAERPDYSSILPKIQVPTLVLHGEKDQLITLESNQTMAACIPNAKLLSIPSGHLSNLENPRAFNQAMGKFLAKVK